jgi:hypothetical protein
MRGKKKKIKKQIRIQDLRPLKDAKGGMPQGPPNMPRGPAPKIPPGPPI